MNGGRGVDDVPWKICNLILLELFNFLSLFSRQESQNWKIEVQ